MLTINTKYEVTNLKGISKIITIENQKDIDFYTPYIDKEGYKFKAVQEDAVKPRIHVSDTACFACE